MTGPTRRRAAARCPPGERRRREFEVVMRDQSLGRELRSRRIEETRRKYYTRGLTGIGAPRRRRTPTTGAAGSLISRRGPSHARTAARLRPCERHWHRSGTCTTQTACSPSSGLTKRRSEEALPRNSPFWGEAVPGPSTGDGGRKSRREEGAHQRNQGETHGVGYGRREGRRNGSRRRRRDRRPHRRIDGSRHDRPPGGRVADGRDGRV